jgi:hypothetical protein
METNQTTIKAELTLEERLAEIAAKMQNSDVKIKPAVKVACPVDPAERALCEGCQ